MSALVFSHPVVAAASVVVGGVILALALRRGRSHETAYLDLWERALATSSLAERLLQRLPSASAIAIAAAAVSAIVAASGPAMRRPGPVDVLYVIDRSATMGVVEDGATRLDRAKTWVGAAMDRRGPDDRILLASAGRTLAPHDGLESIELEAAASDLDRALAALEGFPIPVVVVTDGAGAKAATIARHGLHAHRVGSAVANTGIVDLVVDDRFPEPRVGVRATVESAGRASGPVELVVERDGKEVARGTGALDVPRGPGGLHRVRLATGDAFPLDDAASFVVTSPADSPIVVVGAAGEIDAFLEAAARALAEETGATIARAERASEAPPDAIVLQDGGSIGALPRRSMLFGVSIPEIAVAGDAREVSGAVRCASDDELLRGLVVDRIVARPKLRLESAAAGLRPIADGGGGALLAKIDRPDARAVVAAFRIAESNLSVLGGAFPVIVRRAAAWLARGDAPPAFVRSGDDRAAALEGLPAHGPGTLGAVTLADGRRTAAALLDRAALDVTPGEIRETGDLPHGPPVDEPIAASFAIAALGLLLAAALLQSSSFSAGRARSSVGGFLSRRPTRWTDLRSPKASPSTT
ncbi:MAG TPA: hypothetical protein VKE69_12415 [Planctomycetota bacterium]|nr:hypothetical protein [Planctomycetota bacterium]